MTAKPRDVPAFPTLVIEASTSRGSVALVTGERVLATAAVAMRGQHAERLMPAVAQVLEASGVGVADLERVVCGAGPGSFTSLRIAAAIAKGLTSAGVMTNRRPLASVSSLLLIVATAADRLGVGRYLAMVDALRGECYAALVELAAPADGASLGVQPLAAWRRVPEVEAAQWARDAGAMIVGPGRAIDAWPEAWGVTRLWPLVVEADPTSWEPEYGRLAEAQVRRNIANSARDGP